ncbi:hypothetical protein NPIL_253111 [Nephila pilipes]|uniref:Uncharacterized protein n=1 Tax=Nephila pilipes TaxID=299642 RepID=A0A8X6QDT7_NEPPI|nr:hypothetical protein NPIL_253111 [Nephila pilipes]
MALRGSKKESMIIGLWRSSFGISGTRLFSVESSGLEMRGGARGVSPGIPSESSVILLCLFALEKRVWVGICREDALSLNEFLLWAAR